MFQLNIIIVLMNGCFYNGPVYMAEVCNNGPEDVVMARGNAEGHYKISRAITKFRGPLLQIKGIHTRAIIKTPIP